MRLICITGIDGAGKTTLVHSLVASLSNHHSSVYVYGRTYPILSRLLMSLGRATVLRKQNIWSDYSTYTSSKKRYMRNPALSRIYLLAVLLEYYIQIWLKLTPHYLFGRQVILDRYLYDTIINDIAVQLDYSPAQTMRAIELAFHFLPLPALTIFIDLPEEVAFSRKEDVPHVDYLKERRRLYLAMASRSEVQQLNGLGTQDELLQSALRLIDNSDNQRVNEVAL